MADDMRRFLDQRPINARPPSVMDVVSKWARRHWKPIAASVAAIFLAVVAGVAMLELNRGKLAEANNSLAVANREMEALVHYTTGQYLLEKGDLCAAYRETKAALSIGDRWEYGHLLAKICESASEWVPVARLAIGQSANWVRIASGDPSGRDEYVVLRIGSQLEVHSIREGRRIQRIDLADDDAYATVDVLVVPPAGNAERSALPRLAHLNQRGQLSFYNLPNLERLGPFYSSPELEKIASTRAIDYVRMVANASGSRIAVPVDRQVIVLDTSDPRAVSTIDTFAAERDVESVQLSPRGDKLLFKLRGPGLQAYVKQLAAEEPPERVHVGDCGHFIDENQLIGFRNLAAGGLTSLVNIHDLALKQQTQRLVGESLTLMGTAP